MQVVMGDKVLLTFAILEMLSVLVVLGSGGFVTAAYFNYP